MNWPARAFCCLPRRKRSLKSALVLGDGALDLQKQLVTGAVADGVVEEFDRAAGAPDLLEEQRLVGGFAGPPVGADDGDHVDLGIAHGVAQRVEAGPVETGSAGPLVTEDMRLRQLVAGGLGPGS